MQAQTATKDIKNNPYYRPYQCGLRWSQGNEGLVGLAISIATDLGASPEDVMRIFSMITVESGWQSTARSPKGAVGLMQLTMPAIIDAAKHCGIGDVPPELTLDQIATDEIMNVYLGICYLSYAYSKAGDWDGALAVYNGGFRQLTRLRKNGKVATETKNYIRRVNNLMKSCRSGDALIEYYDKGGK